jgi:uncharacterized protein (TIGR02594 family)
MLRAFSPSLLSTPAADRVRSFLGKPDAPLPDEIATARRVLSEAPATGNPIDVARYFEDITDVNADGWSYIQEWPGSRENPVIIAFFLQGTDSLPYDSDGTRWCAAFLNWCLVRVGRQGTRSSSSGSFRCQGEASVQPKAGDITVFKNHGQDEECRGKGHVAFLVENLGDRVRVCGGNQSDRVKTNVYSRSFNDNQPIALLSIRDIATIE